MKRVFFATELFWKKFYALSPSQKTSVRQAWWKFQIDPFDPSLGTHKIRILSARAGEPGSYFSWMEIKSYLLKLERMKCIGN